MAALASQQRAAQKGSRVGHERKGSPSYALHIDACRNQKKLMHTAVALRATGQDLLEERDENTTPESTTGNDDNGGKGLLLRLDSDTPCLESLRLVSPDSVMYDGLRYRTLSASSRTSVDSLRSQGAISAAKCGSPQDVAHMTPRYNASPLCTSEVYELSHFLEGNGATAAAAAATVRNPNKVLLTIDMRTSIITVANSIARSVFGYSQSEFVGMPFTKLLHPDNYLSTMSLLEEHCGPDGDHMRVSEQLLIAVDKCGILFPVSLWMKPSSIGHSLAILEPVERTTGVLTTSFSGDIIDADPQLAPVLGFHDNPSQLLNSSVRALLPKLVLPEKRTDSMPEHLRHQHVTGRIHDGRTLPLTVLMRFSHETDPVLFQGASFPEVHNAFEFGADIQYVVVLYHNVTSLMTVRLDGSICSCDSTFSTLLLGYGQAELQNKSIHDLIPGFLDQVSSAGLKLLKFNTMPYKVHSRHGSVSTSFAACSLSGAGAVGSAAGAGISPTTNELGVILERDSVSPCGDTDADEQRNEIFQSQQESIAVEEGDFWGRSPESEVTSGQSCQPGSRRAKHTRNNPSPKSKAARNALQSGQLLSHSAIGDAAVSGVCITDKDTHWQAGNVMGLSLDMKAVHSDGFDMDINIQVKHILFDNDNSLLCLWVKRDYVASQEVTEVSPALSPREITVDGKDDDDDERGEDGVEAFRGPYAEAYTTLRTVGRGAFGDVKLAAHKITGEEVIVKCIGKKDVLSCSWTSVTLEQREQLNIVSHQSYIEETDSIPTELFLLRTLDHRNIVNLVDVFETEHFYQLVMAKHGEGMDLFEFIDQEPDVDEPLAFYLFSQVVDAVDYLHQRNVIHRDIKDENIIIDQHFHVKLIDFGSAAFMKEGQLFDSFCGTIEYCSPEVLSGNKYRGPELEMWTLGVTLFTLVFFENPFKDADDIIGGHLDTPFAVSSPLTRVVLWLLHPDPVARCTIAKLRTCPWMEQTLDITNYDFDRVLHGELSLHSGNLKLKTMDSSEKRNLSPEPRRMICMSR